MIQNTRNSRNKVDIIRFALVTKLVTLLVTLSQIKYFQAFALVTPVTMVTKNFCL